MRAKHDFYFENSASLLNVDDEAEEFEDHDMINMTTAWFTTTAAPTTEATTEASTVMATTATYSGNFSAVNRTRHKEEKSKKKTKVR